MKQDDILKMAREAGIVVTGEAIWKLCEMVAAAEREACAKIVEQYTGAWDDQGYALAQAIRERVNQ